ncbi:MAG TPA: hypothetical protein VJ783_19705 [Pirellulales bacterium]|nr:hypothetical protein [Pirellulales bacterium]
MPRCRYSIRAFFVISALIASFFAGLKMRRAEFETELARARNEADIAKRENARLQRIVGNAQLQLRLANGRARTAELMAGFRRQNDRESD